MHKTWVRSARCELLRRRAREGVWGYRLSSSPSVEATALACLGILGESDVAGQEAGEVVHQASDWLVAMQRADGSLGVAPGIMDRGWPTSYGLLLWNVLSREQGNRDRAAAWLLAEQGRPISGGPPESSSVLGHDPTLIGWPWVDGTHSWLEPTSLAILALCCQGLGAHPRVAEGVRLLHDRALAHGGWNYGNRSVFGRELRPQPGPTGMALAALASVPGSGRGRAVEAAIAHLLLALPRVHAPVSLGWGVLGLKAWDGCPTEADRWLEDSQARHASRPDSTTGLAILLIAEEPGRLLAALRSHRGGRPA
ncbi:MAG: hypothetical protein U0790_07395 [Isosphaeraceae bacterium]